MKKSPPETPAGRALRTAVAMVLDGSPITEAAMEHGLPMEAVQQALSGYEQGGWDAVGTRKLSSGVAARRKLNAAQGLELQALVVGHLPEELEVEARLWGREAVNELIEQRTGLVLPQRTLSTYLERWGFAPQKPLKSFSRSHPAAMRAWMRTDYPVVALQARDEHALVMWWGDQPLAPSERGGMSPTMLAPSKLMFAVTNRGDIRWMVHHGSASVEVFIAFMERLLHGAYRPLVVIVPDHPHFAAPAFIDWSLRNKGRITFTLLPAELSNVPGSKR